MALWASRRCTPGFEMQPYWSHTDKHFKVLLKDVWGYVVDNAEDWATESLIAVTFTASLSILNGCHVKMRVYFIWFIIFHSYLERHCVQYYNYEWCKLTLTLFLKAESDECSHNICSKMRVSILLYWLWWNLTFMWIYLIKDHKKDFLDLLTFHRKDPWTLYTFG